VSILEEPSFSDLVPRPDRDTDQPQRLLNLRDQLLEEQAAAASPAVARALQIADYHLFLALTYFGYADKLFPEQA
jgi:hypothetical protein